MEMEVKKEMEEIYFSMIVYVDKEELLSRSLNSIVRAPKNIVEKIKIIVVDSVCSEVSMSLCKSWEDKYGKRNFCYFKAYDLSMGDAYNIAIPEIEGRYVNFSLASTWFQTNAIEFIWEVAEEQGRPKLISLTPLTVNEKEEHLRYKMSPSDSGTNAFTEISLNREPEKLQLMFHAYFIRCYLINSRERHMWFNPKLHDDAVTEMLLNLLAEWRNYLYITRMKLNYTIQLEDNTSAYINQHYEWWYMDSIKNWILPFARRWTEIDYPLRQSMRIALLYLVFARYNCNYNDRNKGVLTRDQIEEFGKLSGEVFCYIDSSLIWKKETLQNFTIPRTLKLLFLRLKAQQAKSTCEVVIHGKQLSLWTHRKDIGATGHTLKLLDSERLPNKEAFERTKKDLGQVSTIFIVKREENQIPEFKWAFENSELLPLCELVKEHVILSIINYKDGRLEIDGILSLGDFLNKEQIHLSVYKDKKEIATVYSEVYGLRKVFGVTYYHNYQFHVSIPAFSMNNRSEIQFMIEINDENIPLEIRTSSIYAHVKEDIKGQYWKFSDSWCLNIADKNKLFLSAVDDKRSQKLETDFQSELMKIAENNNAAQIALDIRKRYFELKKEYKDKRIWITFDKLYKAGDNGEYIYNYISKQKDGIDIRYLIKEDSTDYKRMQKNGVQLLAWGEMDTLVTVLLAEAILATHSNIVSYVGFDKMIIPYICDLFNPVNICIQHGLTTQNIAQFQNRIFDNLQLYLCASPREIENLSRPIYGYTDEGALQLAGIARYDGLKSNEKHQILITPTWRRNIAYSNVAHVKKEHNDYFKNSEYYKIYNSLINDAKLIKCAKEYGYRIIYLLHPAASAQIEDFEKNDYVNVIQASSDVNYEKMLTETSLMVTDYSGVQFDFGYMRKPVLYYHPQTLPPHYDESDAYIYETMAFGPVIDKHESLVNSLCAYMKNHCRMEPEYVKRADNFFAFSDFNNCSRIYQSIIGFVNGTGGKYSE